MASTRIALAGPICSGKSTVAQTLCDHCGFRRLSLAAPLKLLGECARHGAGEYARLLLDALRPQAVGLGVMLDAYHRAVVEHEDELRSVGKPRAFLQDLGMRLRGVAPDIFIFALLERARYEGGSLVCDDLRFLDEARAFTAARWRLAWVRCEEDERRRRLAELYPNITPEQLNHQSETALQYVDFDYTITTGVPLEQLPELVQPLLEAVSARRMQ